MSLNLTRSLSQLHGITVTPLDHPPTQSQHQQPQPAQIQIQVQNQPPRPIQHLQISKYTNNPSIQFKQQPQKQTIQVQPLAPPPPPPPPSFIIQQQQQKQQQFEQNLPFHTQQAPFQTQIRSNELISGLQYIQPTTFATPSVSSSFSNLLPTTTTTVRRAPSYTEVSPPSFTTGPMSAPAPPPITTLVPPVRKTRGAPRRKQPPPPPPTPVNRRSSSRSIKRKRFDDEIVEYSIGFPQHRGESSHRVGRPRASATVTSSGARVTRQSSVTQVSGAYAHQDSSGNLPNTSFQSGVNIPTLNTRAGYTYPVNQRGGHTGSTRGVHSANSRGVDRRRNARAAPRKSRKGRPALLVATKDLGRWKPIDDLALISGIQQTNDMRLIHRAVKFSCKFTLQEMQARWHSLLYDPAISRTAMAALRNLHPETVESVARKTPYSVKEEDLLGTIKSCDAPKLEQFEELLAANSSIFHAARTPKILMSHWQMMKQYHLLPDQQLKHLHVDEPLSFSDAEDLILDSELTEYRDETLEIELALADRQNKREIRILENELSRWNVLIDSIPDTGITPEFDGQTLAVLRGRLVRYLMRSKEITFGRAAKHSAVDVDLSLEGAASKISRRQGTIKLRSNGDFFIANEGQRSFFIDGIPLLPGNKTRLANNNVLEICGLRFVFLTNYELINAIRYESAKTTTQLN